MGTALRGESGEYVNSFIQCIIITSLQVAIESTVYIVACIRLGNEIQSIQVTSEAYDGM